jgi:uncharacterized protein (TIGR02646 family)
MRKLSRPSEPIELENERRSYTGSPSQDEAWKNFGRGVGKSKVREVLRSTQNDLCAYCEVALTQSTRIDHFEPKKRGYRLTFDWNNLVLSCDAKDSCDNKKGGEFENYWINPYSTDPAGMFKFYSDGQIEGQSTDAENIIIDFALDCPNLEAKRKGVLKTLELNISSLIEFPDALETYLESEEAIMFPTGYKQIIERTMGA